MIIQIMKVIINLSNIVYMTLLKKFFKILDDIIKYIKKYSVHFVILIPFTVFILNLTKGSLNILKVPITLLELINSFFNTILKLKVLNIIVYISIGYYLLQSLKKYSQILPKKKKKKKN